MEHADNADDDWSSMCARQRDFRLFCSANAAQHDPHTCSFSDPLLEAQLLTVRSPQEAHTTAPSEHAGDRN